MALSTEDAARLASLKAAYDLLITGAHVALAMSGGRQVRYGVGDIPRLRAEIDRLEALAANPTGRQRGAMKFRIS